MGGLQAASVGYVISPRLLSHATNRLCAVFTVPETHDMVSQLLFPNEPKNLSDFLVIGVLLFHVLLLYVLPSSLRIPVFAVVFLFWRACYNGGIGYLLKEQSNYRALVRWAEKTKLFENPKKGNNPNPSIYNLLKREMETKIPKDYKFEEAPIEYNTWLLFRRFVDLILMCDFTSYVLFAFACGGRPADEHAAMTVARWVAGIGLFLFNLWVKLDAHRVVKDYAWYWGDFFFLIDQELTFDGVFEMAPHPMYSVGYAGYYGISLMAASYKVLFISIIAHAAQFAFLALIENPHIDKTYNPLPPRKTTSSASRTGDGGNGQDLGETAAGTSSSKPAGATRPSYVKDLLGLNTIDLHRISDTSSLLLQLYVYTMAVLTPSTPLFKTVFVINAVICRLWYNLGIGYILNRQSNKKKWTRHFIKYGEGNEEAWRQWKGIFHLSMTMCHASFIAAAWKMYALPPDWSYGMVLLRHVLGAAMISLQLWTAVSIYESIGEFGWFFGDFFYDQGPKLTYSGIYRFLNNPERLLGLAGLWGVVIITWSTAVFFLALLAHVLTLCFIHFVERPHMQKRYGQHIRPEAGLQTSLRRSLPPTVRQWQGSVDRAIDETVDLVEEFLESARPKLAAGMGTIVKDTKALFRNYPKRVNIVRLTSDLAGFDTKDYSLEVSGTRSSYEPSLDRASRREGDVAQSARREAADALVLEYGAPIRVRWTAPAHHSQKDWIGLYMLTDNPSRTVTRVASQGRWIGTNRGVWDSPRAEQGILVASSPGSDSDASTGGEVEFRGDKLWWTTGVFEFRYHHDGKHNVLAISAPFEVRIGRFDEDDVEVDDNGTIRTAVAQALLPVVRNCFDRDPEIAPESVEEAFGARVERDGKFARRVVFAVREMFGIDFAPEVVKADGNVQNLAWRICNAKAVLVRKRLSGQMCDKS